MDRTSIVPLEKGNASLFWSILLFLEKFLQQYNAQGRFWESPNRFFHRPLSRDYIILNRFWFLHLKYKICLFLQCPEIQLHEYLFELFLFNDFFESITLALTLLVASIWLVLTRNVHALLTDHKIKKSLCKKRGQTWIL